MPKPKGYTAEQIILKLREADRLLSQGKTIKEICRTGSERANVLSLAQGIRGDEFDPGKKKLKELEKENLWLKKLLADVSLDNAILKEMLSKK